jgi:hypothetical protein
MTPGFSVPLLKQANFSVVLSIALWLDTAVWSAVHPTSTMVLSASRIVFTYSPNKFPIPVVDPVVETGVGFTVGWRKNVAVNDIT